MLAVNKIDLVHFGSQAFEKICEDFQRLVEPLQFSLVITIPISARFGDNVSSRSSRTPWYKGPSLLEFLSKVQIADRSLAAFRMPVQLVTRSDGGFRGIAGTIASGNLKAGEEVMILPSRRITSIREILINGRILCVIQSR